MHTNREHADNARLQCVEEAEGASRSALHIERYSFQPAHVEERLVLDVGQAGVMQEVRVHEAARLMGDRHLLADLLGLLFGVHFAGDVAGGGVRRRDLLLLGGRAARRQG